MADTAVDLAAAFRKADTDKTGTLDKNQFKDVLSAVGIEDVDDNQLATILSMVDLNNDGAVDYAEFCEWAKTKLPKTKIKTYQPKDLVLSAAASEAMGCQYFMQRFDQFKRVADAQVVKEKETKSRSMEFELLNDWMAEAWQKVVATGLQERATAAGLADPQELQRNFAQGHIQQICDLGYALDDAAKEALAAALERFYVCDIGPAPFSLHAVVDADQNDHMVTVTVSEHCLQMATHWIRHPPKFFTGGELEELVVLALFHDVYYYDDFPNHDTRTLDLFRPWLAFELPQQIVGHHLDLAPDPGKIKSMNFSTPLEALQNEWVQMDWYLTMINMKQKGTVKNRVGDGITLPLEFFHHYLGRFLTKDTQLIPVAWEKY